MKQNVNQRGYNKFLVIDNDVMVCIDVDKIVAGAQWNGLKSYVTTRTRTMLRTAEERQIAPLLPD